MQTIFAVNVKFRTAVESPSGGRHTPKVWMVVFLDFCNVTNCLEMRDKEEVLDALVDAARSFVDV